jgi:hypothetical protein
MAHLLDSDSEADSEEWRYTTFHPDELRDLLANDDGSAEYAEWIANCRQPHRFAHIPRTEALQHRIDAQSFLAHDAASRQHRDGFAEVLSTLVALQVELHDECDYVDMQRSLATHQLESAAAYDEALEEWEKQPWTAHLPMPFESAAERHDVIAAGKRALMLRVSVSFWHA